MKPFDRSGQHLIISPHCDDAVLALGGTIVLTKANFTVITLFGTCGWTISPDEYSLEEVTRINQAEEREALRAAGCRQVLYEYPEVMLRGYRQWYTKRIHPEDMKLGLKLQATIREHLPGFQHVYFPIAPGPHIDHRLIARQIDALYDECISRGVHVYVYEELPHAWYIGPGRRLEAVGRKYHLTPIVTDITPVIDKKLELLKKYKTQLEPADLDKVLDYAGKIVHGGYGERVWELAKK